jgi:NADPH:quinone reductase-like Zn-dependent oxidoreductase
MKAVRIHSFGNPDVMQIEDIEAPRPEKGEVLIRVVAASVNPVDFKMRNGQFKLPGARMPLTLGRDVSGTIEAVGRGVSGFKVGDEVFALLDSDHGGYAEFVSVRAEAVARKPVSIDHAHASAVPLAAITAWQGLFDHGKLKAGERVLIHGAAGGVGHFAVQFAKNRGAVVFATARAEDAELLRDLGADEVIDYRNERFEDLVHDLDLIFDLVAGETQKRSWNTLKKGGRMVSTLQAPSKSDALKAGAKGEHFMAEPNREELEEIGRMIDDGKIRVVVQESMPLDEVRHAHDMLEHEHVQGKLVLEVAEI